MRNEGGYGEPVVGLELITSVVVEQTVFVDHIEQVVGFLSLPVLPLCAMFTGLGEFFEGFSGLGVGVKFYFFFEIVKGGEENSILLGVGEELDKLKEQ